MSEENPGALNPDLMPINSGPTIGAELAINIGAVSTYKIKTLKEGNWITLMMLNLETQTKTTKMAKSGITQVRGRL